MGRPQRTWHRRALSRCLDPVYPERQDSTRYITAPAR
jgi:hypothetical protein